MQKNELLGLIKARGFTQAEVAQRLGVSNSTFSRKLKRGVFGSDEVDRLIDLLRIDDPMWIFFSRKVTYKDTTSPVYANK